MLCFTLDIKFWWLPSGDILIQLIFKISSSCLNWIVWSIATQANAYITCLQYTSVNKRQY